jgi:hypothetical protein
MSTPLHTMVRMRGAHACSMRGVVQSVSAAQRLAVLHHPPSRAFPAQPQSSRAACAAPLRASRPDNSAEFSSAQAPRRLSFGSNSAAAVDVVEGELMSLWGATPARAPTGGGSDAPSRLCAAPSRPCRPEPMQHAQGETVGPAGPAGPVVRTLHFYGGSLQGAEPYGSPAADPYRALAPQGPAGIANLPGAPRATRVLARWPCGDAANGTQLMF